MLTQEFLKSILYYDEFTGIFIWLDNRNGRVKVGSEAGSIVKCGNSDKSYIHIELNSKAYKAHRLAFLWMEGRFPSEDVDHDDGDGINNKWSNLRSASRKENSKNQRLAKNNTSECAGVFWRKDSGKWRAQIGGGKDKISLGTFFDKEDAIKVRKEAEIKCGYHGNHGQSRPSY